MSCEIWVCLKLQLLLCIIIGAIRNTPAEHLRSQICIYLKRQLKCQACTRTT